MSWKDLVPGDWTTGASPGHLDPYLVWAEATGFADFALLSTRGASAAVPDKIPVLIELNLEKPDRLVVPTAMQQSQAPVEELPGWARDLLRLLGGSAVGIALAPPSRFVTMSIRRGFFKQLADNPDLKRLLKRIEMSRPVSQRRAEEAPLLWFSNTDWATSPVVGVIDNGCAFAHAKFRSNTGTRVAAIWDQDGTMTGAGDPPGVGEPLGVIHRTELEGFMGTATPAGKPIDEDLCYSRAGYKPLRHRATHGTHVLDVLAGSVRPRHRVVIAGQAPPTFAADLASQAGKSDIVFVQLQQAEIEDDSGKWLGVQVLEAMLFICSHAPPGGRAVVNLSYGPHTGPHDGSSILEAAIDELHDVAAYHQRELRVTLSAGNSFANRSHAQFNLPGQGTEELSWHIPPGSETAAFLEIWLPETAPLTNLSVELVPPSGPPSGPVGVGQKRGWFNPSLLAAVIFLETVPQSDKLKMVLVGIAPTFTFSGTNACAPCGVWKVRVSNSAGAQVGPVHAYVARNGTTLGARLRGRQSHLYDPNYDPTRYLRSASDDRRPVPASTLQRRGSLSGIATGVRPQVGAGYVLARKKPAPYSSAGPSVSASPGSPYAAAVSDESTALTGLRGAGTRSASHLRLSGTSIASPQLASWILDPPEVIDATSVVDPGRVGKGLGALP